MLTDLRYAVRSLRRSPGFTLIAVLTLALGIGANTTVFSWMEGLVLNPFPTVREPARLVSVKVVTNSGPNGSMSYPAFAALRAGTRTLEGLTAYQFYQFGLQEHAGDGPAEPVWGAFASVDYFSVLGVHPVLGRAFVASDSVTGAPPIVVIGNGLWRHRFAGDPGVIGRVVRINGHDATVVGVAPPNFAGSFAGLGFELWVPLTTYDQLGDWAGKLKTPYSSWLTTFGRLRSGATVAQARADLDVVGHQVAREYPDAGVTSATAEAFEGGDARQMLAPTFTALLGVTALVLLIVCANLANLLLARAASRRRELGVRAALGAGRGRLARQLLAECLALAVPGAILGVLFAAWGRSALSALIPATGLPLALDTPLDLRVMAFVAGLTIAAVLLFGLAPALRASRPNLAPVLKNGAPGSGLSRSRLRSAFVVAQVALSLVAVVSAALFVRTLHALDQIDPGFHDPAHVLLMSSNFGFAGIHDAIVIRATVARLLERTAAIPGVSSVAVSDDHVPMGLGGGDNWSVSVPGYTPRKGENMTIGASFVTPDYFDVMRIPLLRGRAITASDPSSGAARAIVVNESFADHYLAGREPIGASVSLGLAREPNAVVVGVARNVVRGFDNVSVLAGPAAPAVYTSYSSTPVPTITLLVRTSGDPYAVLPSVRRTIAEVAPGLPVMSPETLEEHAKGAFFLQRVGATVLGALGGVALLLAALGLYGVTAYSVTERTHEVGVRVALGATAHQVIAAFLREGLRLAAFGLVLGALGALGAGQLLASQLYGARARDPLILIGTAGLLAAVAAFASYIPARRASNVDPMTALRTD
jgi:predicted permease